MTDFFITKDTPVSDAALNAIAYIPTEHLPKLVAPEFFRKLADKDFMRIGTLLAQKSYDEEGCPIGGVIIDNATRQIIGKGHNTLGQEGWRSLRAKARWISARPPCSRRSRRAKSVVPRYATAAILRKW